MMPNTETRQKIAGYDKDIYLTALVSMGNLDASNKDIVYTFAGSTYGQDTYWSLAKNATLRIERESGFLSSAVLIASKKIKLDGITTDSTFTLSVPVNEDATRFLADQDDPFIPITLRVYPVDLSDYLMGAKVVESARVYRHGSLESGFATVTDSAGLGIENPLQQIIIPGSKRYTAVIVYYDDPSPDRCSDQSTPIDIAECAFTCKQKQDTVYARRRKQ
jgi:hypothetical protein